MDLGKAIALRVPAIRKVWEQRNQLLEQAVAVSPPSSSLSEVINVGRYNDPEWMKLHHELEAYATDKHVFQHTGGEVYRKGWEWTHCLYGLSKLGAIRPEAIALGVGAGREPVIFWLADRIRKVTATDLYGNERWSNNVGEEAPAAILEDCKAFCPKPFKAENVRFENADGTALPYDDNSVDFCWSLSSIEHFGGVDAAAKAIAEMGRVTKPGGIVCVATEYLILDQDHPEYFTKAEIEGKLIPAHPSLSLVDGMNWKLPPLEYLTDPVDTDSADVHRLKHHVIMKSGHYRWTSFMLFFRKN